MNEAIQSVAEFTQQRNIRGRRLAVLKVVRDHLVINEKSVAQELREEVRRWVRSMQLPEFWTLTLACQRCIRQGIGHKTDAGHDDSVPGVQKSGKLVLKWLEYTKAAFVVEEFGNGGRRHFHALADGASAYRPGKKYCVPCNAGTRHSVNHHSGGNASDYWTKAAGFVKNGGIVKDPVKATNYVVKTISYVLKELMNDDYERAAVHAKRNDYAERRTAAGRFWVKQPGPDAARRTKDDVSGSVRRTLKGVGV